MMYGYRARQRAGLSAADQGFRNSYRGSDNDIDIYTVGSHQPISDLRVYVNTSPATIPR